MAIVVRRSGMFTTVQDGGRWGYQHFGVPVAGPMDYLSHRLSNHLVGNEAIAAALEVTLQGPELLFEEDSLFAVTGAVFDLRLDGIVVANGKAILAQAGQLLDFGARRKGARAYLAVSGGFDVPIVLGSRSTHVTSGMGGVKGRQLKIHDRLPIGSVEFQKRKLAILRESIRPLPVNGTKVRVIISSSSRVFSDEAIQRFQHFRYRVTSSSDRMGYRLEGGPLYVGGMDGLISTPLPVGAVQVTPGGNPILLMADHQTIGGYPSIATVITADLPQVGQLTVSDWIEFEECSQEEAIQALIIQERRLMD